MLASADTVLDARLAGGLAGIAPGQLLEIYGCYDGARAAYTATPIGPADAATGHRVSGPVAAVDAQAGSFTLGRQSYGLAGSNSSPASGDQLRLRLQTSTDRSGR